MVYKKIRTIKGTRRLNPAVPAVKPVDVRQDRQIKRLRKRLNKYAPEIKWIVDRGSVSSTIAGALTQMSGVAQGDANGQRDGLVITNRNYSFNYTISNVGTSQTSARVILFRWKGNYNTMPPLVSYILYNASGGANPDVQSVYNPVYKDKFTILFDKLHVFARDNAASDPSNVVQKVFNYNIPTKFKTRYIDDVATHYENGSIFLLFIGANTNVSLGYNGILRYFD